MDIILIDSEDSAYIHPESVHGMLWLQTHFENNQWEAIATSQIKLSKSDADDLYLDASQAGLSLNYSPAFSNRKKFYQNQTKI